MTSVVALVEESPEAPTTALKIAVIKKLLFGKGFQSDQLSILQTRISLKSLERIVSERDGHSIIAIYSLTEVIDETTSIGSFFSVVSDATERDTRLLFLAEDLDTKMNAGEFLKNFFAATKAIRKSFQSELIKTGMRKAKLDGKPVGRPKKAKDDDVIRLRSQGWSLKKIARTLEISKGAVQYSLRHQK